MAANNGAALQQALDDCCRLLVLVHQVIANPTQTNIDVVVNAYATAQSGSQNLIPKPSYSSGGVSFQWETYRKSLQDSIRDLQELIVLVTGPYQFTVHGR